MEEEPKYGGIFTLSTRRDLGGGWGGMFGGGGSQTASVIGAIQGGGHL